MKSFTVPPGKLSDEGEAQCCLKTHGEKDKLLQNVITACYRVKATFWQCLASLFSKSKSKKCELPYAFEYYGKPRRFEFK